MNTTRNYAVTGMSCGHCEAAIRSEVSEVDGVSDIEVSAQTGRLTVTYGQPVADAAVIAAVEEAGFTASRS